MGQPLLVPCNHRIFSEFIWICGDKNSWICSGVSIQFNTPECKGCIVPRTASWCKVSFAFQVANVSGQGRGIHLFQSLHLRLLSRMHACIYKWSLFLSVPLVISHCPFIYYYYFPFRSLLTICLQLTIPQIKAEMERTLQWLAPTASNTTK